MKNIIKHVSIVGAIIVVLAVAVLGVVGVKPQAATNQVTGEAVAFTGEVQEVALTFKNYEYQLSPSTLTNGVPVRMTVDMDSVYGCMRDVVIPAFDVRKYVREGDNVIEFMPDKSGTFNIQCSMNMGRGSFSVVDADGSESSYVEEVAAAPVGGSCGASTGSCGCGA